MSSALCDSPSNDDNQNTRILSTTGEKPRLLSLQPTCVKKFKASLAIKKGSDGIYALAVAKKNKNEIKKSELQLRCISAIHNEQANTELLMKFLSSDSILKKEKT